MDRELQREAAKLYALPPAEYTAARNERAKALRQTQPELAAGVAALSKPTVAAAAINRLARDEPSEVRALAQAGRALRAAQEASLAGKGATDALASATREHRAALERMQREARRLELSQPVLERVASTLRAASLDPELQQLLERGLLAEDVQAAGFGLDPALGVAAPTKQPRTKPKRDDEKRQLAEQRARLKAARARLAEAMRDAAAANKELARAEAKATSAGRDVEAAKRAVAAQATSTAKPSRRRTRSDSET